MSARTTVVTILCVASLADCGSHTPTSSSLQVTRDTVGDTIVVRTVSGSAWGTPGRLVPDVSIGKVEGDAHYLFGQVASLAVAADGTIYVVDSQAAEVRAFDPSGTWLRTLGRRGEGPGELKQPEAVAVLSDGRVVVRDPGNARLQVYGPDGAPVAEWLLRSTLYTSAPLWTDTKDDVYIEYRMPSELGPGHRRYGLIRYGPDGAVVDTLRPPSIGYRTPLVVAHGKDASASFALPFSPMEQWTVHPDGYFVYGLSTAYRIDLLRNHAPTLRIEKSYEPVPVGPAEKEAEKQMVVHWIRGTVPGWKWDGPSIPDRKPPFNLILVGHHGRLWVDVPQPAVERPNPDYDPKDDTSLPTVWKEPARFDVFRPDGTYLGRVAAPADLTLYPQPFFRSDTVWAVTRDSLDVQRVVRYHVQHGAAVRH